MTTWNNRIVRYRKRGHGCGLHEVHYDERGRPWGMTELAEFVGATPAEIQLALATALFDAHRLPVLTEPKRWPGSVPGSTQMPRRKRAKLSTPQQGSER